MKWIILIIFNLSMSAIFSQDLKEAVQALKDINKSAEIVNPAEKYCIICNTETPMKKWELSNLDFDLSKIAIYESKKPYVIRLIRNAQSPKKIAINYENGQDECIRESIGINPYTKNFEYHGCMLKMMRFRKEVMEIDLSTLRPLQNDETEIIDIVLSKKDARKYPIDVLVERPMGEKIQFKTGKKFFSDGINVNLFEPKEVSK